MNTTESAVASGERPGSREAAPEEPATVRLSDQLEGWLTGEGARTLGSLVHTFGDKSFAILLVLLLGVPALPLPTGGVTHVFEIIAALIGLELIGGLDALWLPRRWRDLQLAGPRQQRFIAGLMRFIRRLERHSRPRMRFLFHRRSADIVFGLLAIAGTAGAFLAPPFSGLDTLPALGVVVLSLGVLLEDVLVAAAGMALGVAGITLELALGAAALHGISSIL
ncbi:MAG TPA: exopolysaccharide biosynthesis protein [Solirubrobacteraceae bacterium]|nr:exopolysaccharide biosynthesis protein [Solirubrobacteraceae bacterium]